MNQTNKNSSPGSDRVTSELVINGGKYLVAALNILLQASYQLGHFLKPWKNKKRIYLKKPGKVAIMFLAHSDQYLLLIPLVKTLKELYYKKQSTH